MRFSGGGCGVVLLVPVLGLVAALPARPAAAQEGYPPAEVYTSADAFAQDRFVRTPIDLHVDYAESSARAVNPDGSPVFDNFAEARASSTLGGPFKVYAAVGGTAGDPSAVNQSLEAETSASQLSDYRVVSSTLPHGTPVQGTLTMHFSGTLDLKHAPGATFTGRQLLAEVDAIVQLIGVGGFYEGGATIDGNGNTYDYGDWEGDFVLTDHGGGHRSATLDITETVTFETTIGAEFQFHLDLIAHAEAHAPVGVSATADFFDTATMNFSAPEGVSIVLVPEPAAASMLLGGVLLLARRRR